ncbi:PREDICTED: NADH-cytochrome b5 reductase-like [Priapulus caudatus]|uniref:NADH-cytochrome b5 reductase n=1 Tax=Priapulus caudatus TaxID=37621 RepID=A0ABM1EDW1_PRICU|nr:PREDICTED: NADH-cytochrome b5 reductase-like [Priapulus caudatus]
MEGTSSVDAQAPGVNTETSDCDGIVLSSKPLEPMVEDCCGLGCTPCVFDIYEQEVVAWKKQCGFLKYQDPTTHCDKQKFLDKAKYTSFQLISLSAISPDTNIFRFNIPNGGSLHLNPGQHLILRGKFGGRTLTRQYTPISGVSERGYFDVIIKLYPHGKMSRFVKTWNVGDTIEWRGPFGEFLYKANSYRRVVMIAGGTGITPMMQVIPQILDNDEDETFVRLIYSNRDYDGVLLKSRLDSRKDMWNFTVLYVLTKASQDVCAVKYGDNILFGCINKELLEKELKVADGKQLVLICGTKSFDRDVIAIVKEMGLSENSYFRF